jgi:hypothetical protein
VLFIENFLTPQKDWSNPNVRPHIQVYPEIAKDSVVSEVWHAEKWMKMDRHLLSPMYDDGKGRHYYIDELTRLKSGGMIIPLQWIIVEGVVHANAVRVTLNSTVCTSHCIFLRFSKSIFKGHCLSRTRSECNTFQYC